VIKVEASKLTVEEGYDVTIKSLKKSPTPFENKAVVVAPREADANVVPFVSIDIETLNFYDFFLMYLPS
jgi:hypothetical protein